MTKETEVERQRIAHFWLDVLTEVNFPPSAKLRLRYSKVDYYTKCLGLVIPDGGKLWFLGYEVIVDNLSPHHIRDVIRYSDNKYRESQLKATRHPWDLAYVYAHGEPFKRFDPTAALSTQHFSARNIRPDGTLRAISASQSRANVLAYADQVNRENIKLREELESALARVQRSERRVMELEADYKRADESATSILRALNDVEASGKELLSRATAAEAKVKTLEGILEFANKEILRYSRYVAAQKDAK